METKPYEYAVIVECGGLVAGEWCYRGYEDALKMYYYARDMVQRGKTARTYAVTLSQDNEIIHRYMHHTSYGVIVDE